MLAAGQTPRIFGVPYAPVVSNNGYWCGGNFIVCADWNVREGALLLLIAFSTHEYKHTCYNTRRCECINFLFCKHATGISLSFRFQMVTTLGYAIYEVMS